ncbi:MAG: hypothetical protein GY729_10735 [Desulfobacteraceae bacterium]|nr:hypothetical protein [Desulfobacteraceae bacterium]
MVKIFRRTPLNTEKNNIKKVKAEPKKENKNYYFYIEYETLMQDDQDGKRKEIKSFCAYYNADFSGRGFVEIIHPALELHQIRCNLTQLVFGIIFEIDKDQDFKAVYIPDFDRIVWKKNLDKYEPDALTALIEKSIPHTAKFGDSHQS